MVSSDDVSDFVFACFPFIDSFFWHVLFCRPWWRDSSTWALNARVT
jgi:hypothetical protein